MDVPRVEVFVILSHHRLKMPDLAERVDVYGVSAQWQRNAPLDGLQDTYAAIAGENVRVYTAAAPADEPYIVVDAAYPQGTLLKPGTNGIGTIADTDHDIAGAVLVQQSFASGDLVQCRGSRPLRPPVHIVEKQYLHWF